MRCSRGLSEPPGGYLPSRGVSHTSQDHTGRLGHVWAHALTEENRPLSNKSEGGTGTAVGATHDEDRCLVRVLWQEPVVAMVDANFCRSDIFAHDLNRLKTPLKVPENCRTRGIGVWLVRCG